MKPELDLLTGILTVWAAYAGGLEVGVDAVGVGGCELREGLFPVRGHLAFDEAA